MALDSLDTTFRQWGVAGPLRIALPPAYSNHPYANVVYMQSVIAHPESLMFDGDFPLPNIDVHEHPTDPALTPYHFENHGSNATLLTPIEGLLWPIGFTAWRDLYVDERTILLPTPTLISADGPLLKPVAAYGAAAINKVALDPFQTKVRLVHISPIVWTFAGHGVPSFAPGEWRSDYVLEETPDGTMVSWMPAFPSYKDTKLGLAVVEGGPDRTAELEKRLPQWWIAERRLRDLIVTGGSIEARRRALAELAERNPHHPMLEHFRIVAEVGSDQFTSVWRSRQQATCDLPTWNLIRYTDVGWDELHRLPCFKLVRKMPVHFLREYIDGNIVLRFHDEDDDELRSIARDLVQHSFLGRESRGFNFILTDFAALWLDRAK
jgi:hypothetical protein